MPSSDRQDPASAPSVEALLTMIHWFFRMDQDISAYQIDQSTTRAPLHTCSL